MEAGDLLDSVKFSDGVKKALRAGSHCDREELFPPTPVPSYHEEFMFFFHK